MKNLFTYPNDSATHYIDPDYVGDANSGMTKRIDELRTGNYQSWGTGRAPTVSTDTLMEEFSKYVNYLNANKNLANLSMYDLWNNPVVIAHKQIIGSETISSITQANGNPLVINFTTPHEFETGMFVVPSGITGTAAFLNNIGYSALKQSETSIALQYVGGAKSGAAVRVWELADTKTVINTSLTDIAGDWDQVTVNSSAAEQASLVSGLPVTLSEFTGSLADYNSEQFYINRLSDTSFSLFHDSALTDPFVWIELQSEQPVFVNNDVGSQSATPIQVSLNFTQQVTSGAEITFASEVGWPGTILPSQSIQKILSDNSPLYLKTTSTGLLYELYLDTDLTQPLSNAVLKTLDTTNTLTSEHTVRMLTTLGNNSASGDITGIQLTGGVTIPTLTGGVYVTGNQFSSANSSATAGFASAMAGDWTFNSDQIAESGFLDKYWVATETVTKQPVANQYVWPVLDDGGQDISTSGYFTLADYSSRMAESLVVGSGWRDIRNTGGNLVPANSVITDTGRTLGGEKLYSLPGGVHSLSTSYPTLPEYTVNNPPGNPEWQTQSYDPVAGEQPVWMIIREYEEADLLPGSLIHYLWQFRENPYSVPGSPVYYDLAPEAQGPILYRVIADTWIVLTPLADRPVKHLLDDTIEIRFDARYWDRATSTVGAPYDPVSAATGYTYLQSPSAPESVLVTEKRNLIRAKTFKAFNQRSDWEPATTVADVGNVWVPSTAGKLTEVHTPVLGELNRLNWTDTTNGGVAVANSEPFKYEVWATEIVSLGNKTYSYKDSNNQTAYGASVSSTQFWQAGNTSISTIASGERQARFNCTVNSTGKLTNVTVDEQTGAEGRYDDASPILLVIQSQPDQYVPVPLTPAELADVWDTEDQWTTPGFDTTKEWPTLHKPESASVTVSQPSSVSMSQAGVKYVKNSGFTKWQLEVTYAPMPAEDFQVYNAVVQAARGQTTPFYFVLEYPGNSTTTQTTNILFSSWDRGAGPDTVRLREPASGADTTLLLEGFAPGTTAFQQGEVIVAGSRNGNIATVLNTVTANAFGEAKIRTAYPITAKSAGSQVFKDPYHVIVTLSSDDFVYSVGTDGLYRMSVTFTLDEWK